MIHFFYFIFLMPFLERDKYYEEICDEAENYCTQLAHKIIKK